MPRPTRQTVVTAALTGAIVLVIAVPATALTTTALAPVPTQPPAVTVTTTVTPPVPTVQVAAPAPSPTAEQAPPPQPPEIVPNDPAEGDGGPAVDLGARAGASGFPVADADHNLVSYTVVQGDSFFDIAQRFDIAQARLLKMNPDIAEIGEAVYIGQVINLDWTKGGGG